MKYKKNRVENSGINAKMCKSRKKKLWSYLKLNRREDKKRRQNKNHLL